MTRLIFSGAEMGRRLIDGSEARFAAYVEGLASVIGHADRVAPLEAYCIGLLLPGERKSVEPMAAIIAPERVCAQHQSMLHFIAQGNWSDEKVLGKVREMVVPEMRAGPRESDNWLSLARLWERTSTDEQVETQSLRR